MIPFIALSDIHIGWKLYNLPELAQDLRDNLDQVVTMAITNKIKVIAIAGDLFDTNEPAPDDVAFVNALVKRASREGTKIVGIAGDHDKPVNGYSWSQIAGIEHVNTISSFLGVNYNDDPKVVFSELKSVDADRRHDVEFLFLHGQEPALFNYVEPKKNLNLRDFPVFDLFPNIKGIVLGDIHIPISASMEEGDKKIWLGYCGSLGIIKSNEIGTKTGILYYDGERFTRLPFKLDREFIKIDLTQTLNFDATPYIEKFKSNLGKKPVFRIEYDRSKEEQLEQVKDLYQIGLVRTTQKRKMFIEETTEESSVNIRSELSTKERISVVLESNIKDPEQRELMYSLLQEVDPKKVLDEYTEKMLNPKQDNEKS